MFPRALLVALLVFTVVVAPAAAIDWQIETIDVIHTSGFRASLALDSQGTPHIIYLVQSSGDFRYATRVSGAWSVQLAHAHLDSRMGPTTVILPGDVPAFSAAGDFFVRTGPSWLNEDMGTDGFWCSTAAVGPDGAVQGISQGSFGSGAYIGFLNAAERHEGVWSEQKLLMNTVFYPLQPSESMIVDANGNPHASVTTTNTEPLRYWHRENGVWLSEPLSLGLWSSIALDAQGSPRISFYDAAEQNLVVATRDANGWTLTPIDETGDVGLYTSQVVRNNVSYVSYYDKTNGDLKLATFVSPNQFSTTTVDTNGDVGAWTSLAIDAQGRPQIAYQDAGNGQLKYASGAVPLATRSSTLGGLKALYRH